MAAISKAIYRDVAKPDAAVPVNGMRLTGRVHEGEQPAPLSNYQLQYALEISPFEDAWMSLFNAEVWGAARRGQNIL
jgi:hypothetical protein